MGGRVVECNFRSRLERTYSEFLTSQVYRGRIKKWLFEPITFRLGFRTSYTPDFLIELNNLEAEFHEVKGSWKGTKIQTRQGEAFIRQDESRIKIHVAARMFPLFRFVSVTQKREAPKDWIHKEIPWQ